MKISKTIAAFAAGIIMLSAAAAPVTVQTGLSAYAISTEQSDELGEELTDGVFTYELAGGSYTIISTDPTAIVSEIPEMRNGYAVTAIAERGLAGCSMISSLTVPDTVTSIGAMAFAGCTSLKSIALPSRIQEIPEGAFLGCSMLEDIEIPDKVTSIGDNAFYGCAALREIRLPSELSMLGEMVFAESMNLETIDASATDRFVFSDNILYNKEKTKIYRGSTALTGDLYIDDTVTDIGGGAFSLCEKIENVFLPSSVQHIGDDAFGYCGGLKSVHFAEGLTTINYVAFKSCVSLVSVDLPQTLTEIEPGAFYNCRSLERVQLPDSLQTIGEGAFLCCDSLKRVIVPAGTSSIGENAFGYTEDSEGTAVKEEDFELSVYSGSEGLSYAKKNGLEYVVADRSLGKVLFIALGAGLVIIAAAAAFVLMRKGKKSPERAVKQADKESAERAEEESYKGIIE
ncbi:MAG: leucine-rich repeat domain-containing protein [Ruminococcus sp.]|nr:leucine-rich repeat domain-containing protein [Ruminococcus sp.]